MRFLAIFLTLVIFAGSQAGPVSETHQPENIIQDYVRSFLNITREGWDSLRNSERGQDFVVLVTSFAESVNSTRAEILSEAQKFALKLGVDVNPLTDELAGKIDLVLKEGRQKILAALKKAQEGTADAVETLRQHVASITEGEQRDQIWERVLGLFGEEQKRQMQQSILEIQQKLKKALQSQIRQTKPTVQQVVRKVSAWADVLQKSFSDLGNQVTNLWSSLQ